MNLHCLIAVVLLIAPPAAVPAAAAPTMPALAAPMTATLASATPWGAAPVRTMRERNQQTSDSEGRVRAAELRVFVLYGPHEFSTFSSDRACLWAAGETAPRGPPFDRHSDDRWLGFDKAQHVAFSFLWTLGTQYVAVNKGRFSEAHALPISVGSSALVGLSKEYYDLRSGPPNVFSYKDLVADGIGILLAVGIILL